MFAHKAMQSPIKMRLAVIGAIIAAYLAALLPLAMFGHEGLFWIGVLGAGGLPLLMIAGITGFLLSAQIAKAPWKWSLTAGIAGLVLACVALAIMGGPWWTGLFGAPVADLAAVVFPLALRVLQPA
jgi:hypothetical protein